MGGGGDPNFFLHNLSSQVMVRLCTEFQLSSLPGSALTVCVVGGQLWLRVHLVIAFDKTLA